MALSHKNDLHTFAVQRQLQDDHGVTCHVIEIDDQLHNGAVAWSNGVARLRDTAGEWIDVDDIGVIWARRTRFPQLDDDGSFAEHELEFVTNQWRETLYGVLATNPEAVWVNDPAAVRRAENKILQLGVAQSLGLRAPKTFIGQDVDELTTFLDQLDGDDVAVKAVCGSRRMQTQTLRINKQELLSNPHSIRVAPAIYQEVIEGDEHLRLHVLGDEVVTVRVESDTFDWRTDLHVPFSPTAIDREFERSVCEVARRLGLRMAIMDAKVTPDGEVVWLESNQQGQFLFMQALSGTDLIGPVAKFLAGELSAATPTVSAA